LPKLSRRRFAAVTAGAAGLLQTGIARGQSRPPAETRQIYPGVWRIRFGNPESLSPVVLRNYQPAEAALERLPKVESLPFPIEAITAAVTRRGTLLSIPLGPNELIYGLGLQLQSFLQRGLKKKLRVNADPKIDSGDSHAPVPFYVTTRGYGVLIDTSRYATIYCGNKKKKGAPVVKVNPPEPDAVGAGALPAAYGRYRIAEPSSVLAEIPEAGGVDVYVFAGPAMRDAVARYNLFSGGGPLPPRWGLGFWYRCYGQFNQEQVLKTARDLRDSRIPCDVLGLEPGWQTHAYSCTYVWSDKFPNPGALLRHLSGESYRVNLWEHAFVHPTSPLYKELEPLSGDYEVWDGLVPDFLVPETRRIFSEFHERHHISRGVSGYKLDECDNSDFTGNWSFPEVSRFPSGADGEQMHCFFGLRYQDAIQSAFDRRRQRTYGLARSSHALAAPYPYVLYSDLYDHREFVRGVAAAGFSGLLWCPEVRDARNAEDLLRRLQTAIFSPLAMVNAWYIPNPPWKQVNRPANTRGEFAPDWKQTEAACREIIEWRMRLLPYFYAAFVKYHETGVPPFRALVMDFPTDPGVWTIDDQYLAGDALLVAPLVAGEESREVYLPEGDWYDFWTGERREGHQKIRVSPPVTRIPVYVRSGTLLPLAEGGLHAEDPANWRIHVRSYGPDPSPAYLIEDDGGVTPQFTRVELSWPPNKQDGSVVRTGPPQKRQYEIVGWERTRS
jgi:alpha-D-xyloside xylohydrolase